MWSVRVRPFKGESLDSFLARQASAIQCPVLHLTRQVSLDPSANTVKPDFKLLAAASGLDRSVFEAMSNQHRPHPVHTAKVQLPASCQWHCPDCASIGAEARDKNLILDFACLEHDRLKINPALGGAAEDLDDELRDLQQRIHGFLSWAGSVTGASATLRAIRPLIQSLTLVSVNTDYGSTQDEHRASTELRNVIDEHGPDSPKRVAELLRYVWPIVESPMLRDFVISYLSRFDSWHASHPDPRYRDAVYGTQETVAWWDVVSIPRRLSQYGARVGTSLVPQMYGFNEEPFLLDCVNPHTDQIWRNRGAAGQLTRELLKVQDGFRAGRSIQSVRVVQPWDDRDDLHSTLQALDVLTVIPQLIDLIDMLEKEGRSDANTGLLGLPMSQLMRCAPQVRPRSGDRDLVEMWLWLHRTSGTDAQTTIPWQPLDELVSLDSKLKPEEKVALLDYQDDLLAELGIAAPSGRAMGERAIDEVSA